MAKKDGVSAGMIVAATVMGGMLGAVAGLLLAPQSGKKTQEKLLETYGTAAKTIGDSAVKIDKTVASIAEKVVSEIKEMPAQIKNEVGRITKEAEATFSKNIEKGSSFVDQLAGTVTATLQEGKKKLIEQKEKLL